MASGARRNDGLINGHKWNNRVIRDTVHKSERRRVTVRNVVHTKINEGVEELIE